MIVTCECNNCLLKDLCINRNRLVTEFEATHGNDFMYVTLKCKHLHPKFKSKLFKCDKCKNKPVCKVHHLNTTSADIYLECVKHEVKTKCEYKLPKDAFNIEICCKGYMPIDTSKSIKGET